MKTWLKKLSALAFTLVMAMCLSLTAFAADSTVTFKSMKEGFDFGSGSEYTDTDLFTGLKNAMPGDQLTENIQIKNDAKDCDYIKVYLRAVPHDEENNPPVYEGTQQETVASMQQFLSQLTLRVYNGSELIYENSADQLGTLENNVYLGDLANGQTLNVKVELSVPTDLGNEYANRAGEVDWMFLAEGIQYEKLTVHKVWDDNGYPNRPNSVKVDLLRDGEAYESITLNADNQWTYTWDQLDDRYDWTVKEQDVKGYEVKYTTKDNTVFITNHMDYVPESPSDKTVTSSGDYQSLTVKKVWSDNNNQYGNRPSSVTMTLYNGETAVTNVTLSDQNGWIFTWSDLDKNGNWSVLESGIPAGYVPSYQKDGTVVTVTNTAALIQTGQLNWPILVLGGLGILLIALGFVIIARKRKDNHV